MFTGIIAAVGKIQKVCRLGSDLRIIIDSSDLLLEKVTLGDSIAVSGVCLTILQKGSGSFAADVSCETMACTSLAEAQAGERVNLELALALGERLGGHLVSGHVDGLGTILQRSNEGRSVRFTLRSPDTLLRYIVVKGSLCVDGVSLTINAVTETYFELNIVPHTLTHTTLDEFQPGRKVNLEVDMLARYVEGLLFNGPMEAPGNDLRDLWQKRDFIRATERLK